MKVTSSSTCDVRNIAVTFLACVHSSTNMFALKDDIGRVMSEVTGKKLSDEERHDIVEAAGYGDPDGRHASIDMEDYGRIMSNLQRLTLKRGEYVFHEGDEGAQFFFINRGYCFSY